MLIFFKTFYSNRNVHYLPFYFMYCVSAKDIQHVLLTGIEIKINNNKIIFSSTVQNCIKIFKTFSIYLKSIFKFQESDLFH